MCTNKLVWLCQHENRPDTKQTKLTSVPQTSGSHGTSGVRPRVSDVDIDLVAGT